MDENTEDLVLATTREKVGLSLAMLVLTAVVVCIWFISLNSMNEILDTETKVPLENRGNWVLESGSPKFWYNPDDKVISYMGLINENEKREIVSLLRVDGSPSLHVQEYWSIVDELAYKADQRSSDILIFLLISAGLSGVIGVQIRGLGNLVGVACFKNQLDLRRWWPWYLLRPPVGFLLGLVSVVIIRSEIFVPEGTGSTGELWWLAVAVLVGLSVDDFVMRLRHISRAIFGQAER